MIKETTPSSRIVVPGARSLVVPSRTDSFKPAAQAPATGIYTRSMFKPADDLPDPVDGPQDKGPNFQGTPNLGVVTPGIYRGAQPTQDGFTELKAVGVKTIIDLRGGHTDVPDLQGLEIGYLNLPVKSWPPDEDQVLDFLKVATDERHQPIFTHCAVGKDRTGLMMCSYRIVIQGWSKEKALAEMEAFGFHDVNFEIKQYLDNMNPDEVRTRLKTWPEPKVNIIH